jgi:hypothetical protein
MSQRAPSCPSGSNYLPNLNDAFVMIINKHLLKVSMCDIFLGLKAWGVESGDSAPVGGGRLRVANGWGKISQSLDRAKMKTGQHLPPLQKQNKRSGQEQAPGRRPWNPGGWFLKPSPAPAAPAAPAPPTAHRRV